jgi:antitoxin (DNA-binding transcriptional repressor) of toxin-antitoxin stability system
MRTADVEEVRVKLPDILGAAHREGVVTVVTRNGVPYAAVAPVSAVLSCLPKTGDLRGSARGCFGEAAEFVDSFCKEW